MIRLINTGRDRMKKTVLEPDGERSRSRYADDKAVADFARAREFGADITDEDFERTVEKIGISARLKKRTK